MTRRPTRTRDGSGAAAQPAAARVYDRLDDRGAGRAGVQDRVRVDARWELVQRWWTAEPVAPDHTDVAGLAAARRRAIGWGGWA